MCKWKTLKLNITYLKCTSEYKFNDLKEDNVKLNIKFQLAGNTYTSEKEKQK